MNAILPISAYVYVRPNPRREAKIKVLTSIGIVSDGKTIATATFGGKYSRAQALTEFRRFPERFVRADSVSEEQLGQYAAAA